MPGGIPHPQLKRFLLLRTWYQEVAHFVRQKPLDIKTILKAYKSYPSVLIQPERADPQPKCQSGATYSHRGVGLLLHAIYESKFSNAAACPSEGSGGASDTSAFPTREDRSRLMRTVREHSDYSTPFCLLSRFYFPDLWFCLSCRFRFHSILFLVEDDVERVAFRNERHEKGSW